MTPRWLRLLASAALAVSIITLLARLVGFARWLVFSPTVGAGLVGTAYQSANQVPNILFEVVAGGALAGAVVPLLAGPIARARPDEVSRIASALLTWAILLTLPLSIALALLHRPLGALLVSGDSPAAEPAGALLLMFSPQLVLYAVGAVLTGVLQAHRRFLWPAFMPLVSSLVMIATYLAYGGVADHPDVASAGPLALLGWGTTAGVAALALPLALPTARTGVRLRPTLRFPAGVATRAVRLAAAGMSALLAQQFAVLMTMLVSNRVGGTGVFVVFGYIQAVYLLPYAVLAIPIATVVFPRLSEQAAEHSPHVAATVRTGTAVIWRVGVAGFVILVAAAFPLQAFFSELDAAADLAAAPFGAMGPAIMLIALAVPGWCMVAWASRVFYALEHSRYAAIGTTTGWALVALTALLGAAWVSSADMAAGTLLLVCAAHAVGLSTAGVLLVVLMIRAAGASAFDGLLPGTMGVAVGGVLAAGVGALAARGLFVWLPLSTVPAAVVAGILGALAGLAVLGAGVLVFERPLVRSALALTSGRIR